MIGHCRDQPGPEQSELGGSSVQKMPADMNLTDRMSQVTRSGFSSGPKGNSVLELKWEEGPAAHTCRDRSSPGRALLSISSSDLFRWTDWKTGDPTHGYQKVS